MRLYSVIILLFIATFSWAKNPKIIIENNLDACVTVKIYIQNGSVNEDSANWEQVNYFDKSICKGDLVRGTINEKWKGSTHVWVALKFKNHSSWLFRKPIPLQKGEELVCRLDATPLDVANEDPSITERVTITFDHLSGKANDAETSFDLIPLNSNYTALLNNELYKSMIVYEANVSNNEGAKEQELFGGMGIFRVDKGKSEKVGINFIPSKQINVQEQGSELETTEDSKNYIFYFSGEYLREQLGTFPYKIPDINNINVIETDNLYKIEFHFTKLKKATFKPVQFSDENTINSLWNNLDKNIRSLFIEDYIYTTRTSSDREDATVLVYDHMITYEKLEVDIKEYEPRSKIEPSQSNSAILTTKGTYYPTMKEIRQKVYEDGILAIGIDKKSKTNNQVLDEFIHEKAKSYIENTLKDIDSDTRITTDLLRKLSAFNQKGYLKTDRNTDLENIVKFLENVLNDFNKKR